MNKWQTYFLAAFAVALIYFGGLSGLVVGVAIVLYLAIIMTILPKLRVGEEKSQAIERSLRPVDELDEEELSDSLPESLQPVDELDEEEFSFSLPDPAPQGWEKYTVYPLRNRYKIQYCFGGPPTCDETWEYEIKGSQIFHRLIDASEENFDDPVFEVINGTLSEDGMARNTSADFVSERTERRRHDVQWHECRGTVSFEILAIHFRPQPWKVNEILVRKQKKLTAAFAEMERKLLALGAIEKEVGRCSYFTAPDGAPEDVKKRIDDIQKNKSPKSMYSDSCGITFAEFAERKTILATLTRLLSELSQSGTSTKA